MPPGASACCVTAPDHPHVRNPAPNRPTRPASTTPQQPIARSPPTPQPAAHGGRPFARILDAAAAPFAPSVRLGIRYTYSELPLGGQVQVTTRDEEALRAIHEFLAFQRHDHRAGGHAH
jgi:hypothetical protein